MIVHDVYYVSSVLSMKLEIMMFRMMCVAEAIVIVRRQHIRDLRNRFRPG